VALARLTLLKKLLCDKVVEGTGVAEDAQAQIASLEAMENEAKTSSKSWYPYECQECGKRSKASGTRVCHVRIHTNERPYACTLCSSKFKTGSALEVHKIVHSDERPYKCPHCSKTFKQRHHQRQHIGQHLGIRFPCRYCHKTFKWRSGRRGHEKRHEDTQKEEATATIKETSAVRIKEENSAVAQMPAIKKE
jgi:uncharacterized Zn-finger protein